MAEVSGEAAVGELPILGRDYLRKTNCCLVVAHGWVRLNISASKCCASMLCSGKLISLSSMHVRDSSSVNFRPLTMSCVVFTTSSDRFRRSKRETNTSLPSPMPVDYELTNLPSAASGTPAPCLKKVSSHPRIRGKCLLRRRPILPGSSRSVASIQNRVGQVAR